MNARSEVYFLFSFTAFICQHPEYLCNIFTANIIFVKKSSFYIFSLHKEGKKYQIQTSVLNKIKYSADSQI